MAVGGNDGSDHCSSAELLRVHAGSSMPSGAWQSVHPMEYKRFAPAACVLDGRFVVAGGCCLPLVATSLLKVFTELVRCRVWMSARSAEQNYGYSQHRRELR